MSEREGRMLAGFLLIVMGGCFWPFSVVAALVFIGFGSWTLIAPFVTPSK
jgi:hypothetical protein